MCGRTRAGENVTDTSRNGIIRGLDGFCYFGDMLRCEREAEALLRTMLACNLKELERNCKSIGESKHTIKGQNARM